MIVFRLVTVRNDLRDALGIDSAKVYTSLITIIIESAAIDTTFNLAFIIAFAQKSEMQLVFYPLLCQVMVCIIPSCVAYNRTSH